MDHWVGVQYVNTEQFHFIHPGKCVLGSSILQLIELFIRAILNSD